MNYRYGRPRGTMRSSIERSDPRKFAGWGVRWFRSDRGTTVVSSDVSAWTEQVVGTNNLSEATARPAYVAAGSGGSANARAELVFTRANTDGLNFVTLITSSQLFVMASLSCTNEGNVLQEFFVTKEWAILLQSNTNGPWCFFATGTSDAVQIVGQGYVVIDCNMRAVNDVDLTTNGVTINRTNGSGAQARAGASVGRDPNGSSHATTHKLVELLYSTTALPTDVAGRLRAGRGAWLGVHV